MPRSLTAEELRKRNLESVRAVCNAEFAWATPESVEAAEGDAPNLKKFNITAYTGGPMRVGFGYPVVVDLAGMELVGSSLPILKDHDSTKIVAHSESIDKSQKRLKIAGVVSGVGEAAQEVIALAANNFPWQASIGASIEQMEFVEAGDSVTVNGRALSGPLYVARKSTLRETSFVAIGADGNTSGRIAAHLNERKVSMDPELKAHIESLELDPAALSESQIAKIKANFEKSKTPAPAPTPAVAAKPETKSVDELLASMQAEADRKESIRAMFVEACEGRSASEMVELKKIHDGAIESKWDVTRTRQAFQIAAIQQGRGHVAIHVAGQNDATSGEVLEAAICQAGGLKNLDAHYSDQVLSTAQKKFSTGVGIKQMLRMGAKANGHHCDENTSLLEAQRAAFGMLGYNGPSIRAQGWSGFSLPGILGSSAYKFLLEGWGGGEMAWAEICDFISVRDFKQITQYKLSGSLKYEKVGAGGEIKHGTVAEGSYTNQASTYGKMFAITREDIINDDLGALTSVPRELGFGANEAFNEVFWTAFLANTGNFFHTNNANVSTGAFTATNGLTALAAAEAVFFAQTRPNGTPLGRLPNVMLHPNGSYRAALSAMESSNVVGTTGPTPEANTFKDNYKVVRSAYLSMTAISGYSTVKWYLLSVMPGFAVMQAAFLNNQRAPMIESASADFNTLGIQMRGVHDFGVSLFEYRAGVQGSGA